MHKRFALRSSVIAISLFAVSGFAAAADQAPDVSVQGRPAQHRQFDPVARTQHSLDRLATKLNLKEEQKDAWQTYADSALARAQEQSARMQHGRAHKHEAQVDADTASRLDRMAQGMRERAQRMEKVAQDTRAIESVLSPEQKTIFDLYWKAHFHHRMGHRPLA